MVITMVESKNQLKQTQGLVGISWVGTLFPIMQSWLKRRFFGWNCENWHLLYQLASGPSLINDVKSYIISIYVIHMKQH